MWCVPEVAAFALCLLIKYYSSICALVEFHHERYNFINQSIRKIIKWMGAFYNGPWKLMVSVVTCGLTGLGSCQEGLQR